MGEIQKIVEEHNKIAAERGIQKKYAVKKKVNFTGKEPISFGERDGIDHPQGIS